MSENESPADWRDEEIRRTEPCRADRAEWNGLLGLMEMLMVKGRHIDHAELLQFGKVLLLLVEREELLVALLVVDERTKGSCPAKELSRVS